MLHSLWIFGLLFTLASSSHVTFPPNIQQLRNIEQSMEESADPCDSFYLYACGNWEKNLGNENYDEITQWQDYNFNLKLKELLDAEVLQSHTMKTSGHNVMDKMTVYYRSCLARNDSDLIKYFDHVKPGKGLEWPLIQLRNGAENIEWPSFGFNILELLGELNGYDFNNVLTQVGFYRHQNGTFEVYLDVADVSDEEPVGLRELAVIIIFFGFSLDEAVQYSQEFKKNDRFWKEAYEKYSAGEAEEKSLSYGQLRTEYPQLYKYLESVVPHVLSPSDEVTIFNVEYFDFLIQYCSHASHSLELVNYLWFKFMIQLGNDAEKDCVPDVRKKLEMLVNYMYYRHSYLPVSKQYNAEVATITENIFKYLLQVLDENHMKLTSKQMAKIKEKLSHLKINMGNLPENVDKNKLTEFFADTGDLHVDDYAFNHLALLRHRFKTGLLCYQNETHSLEYNDSPSYDIDVNMVSIPFSYLQAPIYDVGYDSLFVWSLFGFLLSGQFSHSIDRAGLKQDKYGLHSNVFEDILNNTHFADTVECLEEQVNLNNTDIVIYNNIGLRVAYRAYVNENRMHLQPAFTKIPWNQLFFLNLAQYFCGNDGDDAGYLEQMVANSYEFAEAFRCPLNSNLNPQKKCRLY